MVLNSHSLNYKWANKSPTNPHSTVGHIKFINWNCRFNAGVAACWGLLLRMYVCMYVCMYVRMLWLSQCISGSSVSALLVLASSLVHWPHNFNVFWTCNRHPQSNYQFPTNLWFYMKWRRSQRSTKKRLDTTPNCITAVFFRLHQHEMRVRWLFPTVHGTRTGGGSRRGHPFSFVSRHDVSRCPREANLRPRGKGSSRRGVFD